MANLTKTQAETIMKDYIKEHPELQGKEIGYTSYLKAQKETGIDVIQWMSMCRYGKIVGQNNQVYTNLQS